jgi:hypothetical protein
MGMFLAVIRAACHWAINSWCMYNYYPDALSIFKCWYVLLNILQGIFCLGTIVWYVYWCPCCIVKYISFRKGNMRKVLRANKPNPGIVPDLSLISDYKLFKFGRFQEREFNHFDCPYCITLLLRILIISN